MRDMTLKNCASWDEIKKLGPGDVGMILLPLEHGLLRRIWRSLPSRIFLAIAVTRQNKKRKKADNFLKEVSSLSPGDLVVHMDHGIGRFEGLETIKAAGTGA